MPLSDQPLGASDADALIRTTWVLPARAAAATLALAPTAQKADALMCAAALLRQRADTILAAQCARIWRNADMAPAWRDAMRDRLRLDC